MPGSLAAEGVVFEKRYHTRVTTLCNNNCIFCLMDKGQQDCHKTAEDVREELEDAARKGYYKLILSGGEPTTHPDIIGIVAHAKKLGFGKIQAVTNGRMFSYRGFARDIIAAGLDEVTFSIHGHTAAMHDSLTRVGGSFDQIVRGIKNVRSYPKVIVNADIVAVRQNYRSLPQIVEFVLGLGINELNLHSITPFGNAYANLDAISYDLDDAKQYFHQAIDVCKEHRAVVWTSRIPPQYLEGYEEFIRDSFKIAEEVEGMRNTFAGGVAPYCIGKRCVYCKVQALCPKIVSIKERLEKNVPLDLLALDAVQISEKNWAQPLVPADTLKVTNLSGVSVEHAAGLLARSKKAGYRKIMVSASPGTFLEGDAWKTLLSQGANSFQLLVGRADEGWMRGGAQFQKAKEMLADMRKAGVSIETHTEIRKDNFLGLKKVAEVILGLDVDCAYFSYASPKEKLYGDYAPIAVDLRYAMPQLAECIRILRPKVMVRDIPPCFAAGFGKGLARYFLAGESLEADCNDFNGNGFDACRYARHAHLRIRIKGLGCRRCAYDKGCAGIFKKYIRLFRFSSLKPVDVAEELN